ncbi:MAG: ComEC/Rec2 family competence protein, partial [Ahrensia sp.]
MVQKTRKARSKLLDDATDRGVVLDERVHWRLPSAALDRTDVAPSVPTLEPVPSQPVIVKSRKPKIALHLRLARAIQRQWAQEIAKGTGFVLVPVCFGGGALAYWALPVEPALHNIASAWLVVAVLLLVCLRLGAFGPVRLALIVSVLILTGMGAAQWRTHSVATPMVGDAVTTIITGRIVSVETRPDSSAGLTIDLLSTARPTLSYAPDRVRLTVRKPLDGARAGAIVEGRASLRAASGPFRPGGFDFAFHAYFQRIGAYGFFLGAPAIIEGPAPSWADSAANHVANARQWLGKRVRANDNGSPQAAVSAALITGEKTPIPEPDAEVLRLSGLAHILSISGLHMALVAGTVMGAVRAIAALSPGLAARWPIKKYAAAIALVTVAGYLFIAGASVATQRSFLMLGIMLGAVLMDRAAVTIRNLALAALIVMLIAPETTAGPSFQMSFAATASLIALYSGWSAQRFHRDPQQSGGAVLAGLRYAGGYVLALGMTSLVAGAATGLYAVYHFHRIATLGLIANLLAVPIVSIVTMPLAIIGVLAIPFGVDGFVFAAMIASVDAVMVIAQKVVSLSPGAIVGVVPLSSLLLGTLALLCMTLLRSHLRWIGVPATMIALLTFQQQDMPIALISEDGRQIGLLRSGEGMRRMAVNRARPNGFTMEQWQPAFNIEALIKPKKADTINAPPPQDAFACDERQCVGWLVQGSEVAEADAQILAPDPPPRTIAYLHKRPVRADSAAWTTLCARHAVLVH